MISMVCFVLAFLLLYWFISSKLPNVGSFITDVGDKLFSLIFDKNYINEYNRSVNLFGLIASKIRMCFRWIKSKIKKGE